MRVARKAVAVAVQQQQRVHAASEYNNGLFKNTTVPCCRDTRALLASGNEVDAQAFIAENSHKRLWQLLAEHALQGLDLPTAEKAFVHCNDYQGVQLVKHLVKLGDKNKQMAEVSHYS